MKTDPHIVLLEDGCWLADGRGDPARTCVRDNARVFKSKTLAQFGLASARLYRPFARAQILSSEGSGT